MSSVTAETAEGRKTLSVSKINANILGQAMQLEIMSEALSKNGRLQRQEFLIKSAGRTQQITAVFTPDHVKVRRESGENVDEKVLDIPAGALLIDDPTFGVFGKGLPEKGAKTTFYSLDPTVLQLIKNESEFLGEVEVDIDGKKTKAFQINVTEPRATMKLYTNAKGELLYASSILGITLKPITREEALGNPGYVPSIDLAEVSRIVPDKVIEMPRQVNRLVMQLDGAELKRLKTDYYQTVERRGDGSIKLTVHPPAPTESGFTISQARANNSTFAKPSLNVPSDDKEFKDLAAKVLAGEGNAEKAALKISKYVHGIMRPKATVGMLRDAREILRTKEGVCRDYATLAATLMRAAGIPTKVVTGAVYADGAFYYHAWVEAWNGKQWLSLDPTITGGYSDATHIKFAEGNPEEAFITFTLDGVKIKVLEQKTK